MKTGCEGEEGFRIGHPIHLSWGERLWPFVAGEFAFECAAWPVLEIFLVDQVVAWTKKLVRMAIPSGRGLLNSSIVF